MTRQRDGNLPTGEEALATHPDLLALRILQHAEAQGGRLARAYVTSPYTWRFEGSPEVGAIENVVARATGAWEILIWLRLLAPIFSADAAVTGHASITSRGTSVLVHDDDLAYARAINRLDSGLHPLLNTDDVRGHFERRDYETAVFRAMRRVEITVRTEAGLDEGDIGKDLMRKAFNIDTPGPLTDTSQVRGEAAATSDLFAGAIGVFKNPSSHREVDFDDPNDAAEIVLFADLLLRSLDRISARVAVERAEAERLQAEAEAAALEEAAQAAAEKAFENAEATLAAQEAQASAAPQTASLPPVVQPGPLSGGSTADRVIHDYTVGNPNETSMTFLQLWIVDGDGNVVSTVAGGEMLVAPRERIGMGVEVHQPLPEQQELIVRWRDRTGEYEETTGFHPRRHA
jgi:uncharacterized protein (TIGR02391 family)